MFKPVWIKPLNQLKKPAVNATAAADLFVSVMAVYPSYEAKPLIASNVLQYAPMADPVLFVKV